MASAKSTVYVVFGARESKSIVTRRPCELTRGTDLEVGDTTTFWKASFTFMSSSKVRVMRSLSTLSDPAGGLAERNLGGSSSRGPPDGVPMLAHDESIASVTAVRPSAAGRHAGMLENIFFDSISVCIGLIRFDVFDTLFIKETSKINKIIHKFTYKFEICNDVLSKHQKKEVYLQAESLYREN